MIKQIVFSATLLVTLGIFSWTIFRLFRFFRLTRPAYPVKDFGKRFLMTARVAFGQTKIFRFPVVGFFHALVFWGFCIILFGSIEMVIDGLVGFERSLSALGFVYDAIIAAGDVFGFLILVSMIIFLFRRLVLNIKRFAGIELEKKSKLDANIALTLILLLMVTLLGMNSFYVAMNGEEGKGLFPVSQYIAVFWNGYSPGSLHTGHEINWWGHILLIFLFANILPYSKHFHVFMSVPNVFFSSLEPLGKLANMESVANEVKAMMNPDTAFSAAPEGEAPVERFGVLDVEDVSWKNYIDSLSCTECGRCTSVCPANITGKKLSPRKLFIDLRARMKEKGPGLVREGKEYNDKRSLIRDYISEEELWACTTCNACAQECPVNINHPSFIVDMRRYLAMEEAAAPAELNATFTNIENNGAPWQFSPEDRMKWAEEIYMNKV